MTFEDAAAQNEAAFLEILGDVSYSLQKWAKERLAEGDSPMTLRGRLRDAVAACEEAGLR